MELNLNFLKQEGLRMPTKREIMCLQTMAFSIQSIIRILRDASREGSGDMAKKLADFTCSCNALEILIEPIIDYLCNYAGKEANP